MDTKTLKLLAVGFILLLGIVLYPIIQQHLQTTLQHGEISFSDISEGKTQRVNIQSAIATITLVPTGNNWLVASYSASLDKIDGLFRDMQSVSIESIVSNNPMNSDQFGLSSSSGLLMTVTGMYGVKTYEIGNVAASGGFYIKKQGSNNVYLADGNLKDDLSVNIADWRDRIVIRFSTDQAQTITGTGNTSFALTKTGSVWNLMVSGMKKDIGTNDMKSMIENLGTMTASGFYTSEDAATKLRSPDREILSILDLQGKQLTKLTVVPDGSDYFVVVDGKSDFYKVPGYALDDLMKLLKS